MNATQTRRPTTANESTTDIEAEADERLDFADRETDDLIEELDALQENIQKCVDAAMRDGRPDVGETPIAAMEEKYRENHRQVMTELIDRGAI